MSPDEHSASPKSLQTEQSATLEVEINVQKERIRQMMTREKEIKEDIQMLQDELEKRSKEAVVSVAMATEVESPLSESHPEITEPPTAAEKQQQPEDEFEQSDEEAAVVAAVCQQVSSGQQPTSSKSVQTEQSASLEVEKELIRQLMAKERNMKQYIQMLQDELEKRSFEAVVRAARLREVESQLGQADTTELPSTSQQEEQPDEPKYKSKNF